MMAMFNDKPVIGPQGASGVTFTPSVSAEGVISWTNDGGLSNPDPVNIKGIKGDKGDAGNEVIVDVALSDNSKNPVQNKVISTEITGLRDDLTATDSRISKSITEIDNDLVAISDSIDVSNKYIESANYKDERFYFENGIKFKNNVAFSNAQIFNRNRIIKEIKIKGTFENATVYIAKPPVNDMFEVINVWNDSTSGSDTIYPNLFVPKGCYVLFKNDGEMIYTRSVPEECVALNVTMHPTYTVVDSNYGISVSALYTYSNLFGDVADELKRLNNAEEVNADFSIVGFIDVNGNHAKEDNSWGHTDFVKIKTIAGISFALTTLSGTVSSIAYYSADDYSSFISGYIGNGKIIDETKYAPPENAEYVIFTRKFSDDNYCVFTKSIETVLAEIKNKIDYQSKWIGKKAVFLGDSITEGTTTGKENTYPEKLCAKLGIKSFVNYGRGGAPVAGTNSISFVSRYSSMDDDADLVIVMGGTNDFLWGNLPLGSISDRTNVSFYGGLYVLMTGLKSKYPDSTIVFMTPLHWYDNNGNPTGEYEGKGSDFSMNEWAMAVEEMSKVVGIPCIDFRNITGLNPNIDIIRSKYFSNDPVHPNALGNQIAVDRIYKNFELC